MTEIVEQLSEIGARLRFVGVGPKLERESRAMLRVFPQHDRRQEPLQAKRVEGAKMPAVQDYLDCAKEPDLQPRRRLASHSARATRHTAAPVTPACLRIVGMRREHRQRPHAPGTRLSCASTTSYASAGLAPRAMRERRRHPRATANAG